MVIHAILKSSICCRDDLLSKVANLSDKYSFKFLKITAKDQVKLQILLFVYFFTW